MGNRGEYLTPLFSPADPLVCHSIELRASLWEALFDSLYIFSRASQWRQDDVTHATPDEVADELSKSFDDAIFTGCTMIGEVKWLTFSAPSWTLVCDGSVYLKADYPDLWSVIDAAYETDATHFKVPDLIARFPLGSSAFAVQGGEDEHTLTVSEIPSHRHTQDQFGSAPSVVLGELAGFEIAPEAGFTGFEGGGNPHNNMPPFETLLPVIVARLPNAP